MKVLTARARSAAGPSRLVVISFLVLLGLSSVAQADQIQIRVDNLNLSWDQATGRILSTGGADHLLTMTFENLTTGVELGVLSILTDTIQAQLLLSIPPGPGAGTGGNALTDFFNFLIGGLPGLATTVQTGTLDVAYDGNTLDLTGAGDGVATASDLPFNILVMNGAPVAFSFENTMDCETDFCRGVGTGQMTFEARVPEPGALVLLCAGLSGIGVLRRRISS